MTPLAHDSNIILIGMPGVGKSTVGVLLAKATSRNFVDTDVLIQQAHRRRLQDIIDTDGLDHFKRIEERALLDLDVRGHVIATGGSVVYSESAMNHLKTAGVVVHLYLPFDALEPRLANLDERGVVREPGQTLAELYRTRGPLYQRYADFTIDCTGLTHEDVVSAVRTMLQL